MNVWVILVTYEDRTSNVNEGYKTYNDARRAVVKKIDNDDLKMSGDYIFKDLQNDIVYELKSVYIL